MARSPFRAALLLGAVFVLGMACGAAVFHVGQVSVLRGLHEGGHRPMHRPVFEAISRDLGLEEAQAEQLHEILKSTHVKMRGIFEESREEIRELLTPQQLERFDRMHGLRKRRGGPPFGPPPEPPGER